MGICQSISKKEVPLGKIICCSSPDGGTTVNCANIDNISECYVPRMLVQCHDISAIDACQRTDELARSVCDHKDSIFCLGE